MGIGIPRRPVRRRGVGTPALPSAATALAPSRAAAEVSSEQAAFAFANREKEIKAQTRSKRLKAQTAIIQAANKVSAEFDAAPNPDVGAYEASYSAAIQPILDSIDEEDIATTLIAYSERVGSDRARQLQFKANQFARDERVLVLKNNTESLEVQYGLCAIGPEGDACRDSTAATIETDIGFAAVEGDIKKGAGKAILLDSRVRQQNAYIQGFITESPREALAALESGEDRFLQGMSREDFARFQRKAQEGVARLDRDILRAEIAAQIVPNGLLMQRYDERILGMDALSGPEIRADLLEDFKNGDISKDQFLRLDHATLTEQLLFEEKIAGRQVMMARMSGDNIIEPLDMTDPKNKERLDEIYETLFEPLLIRSRTGTGTPAPLGTEQTPGLPRQIGLSEPGLTSVVPEEIWAQTARAMSMVGQYSEKLAGQMQNGIGSRHPKQYLEAAEIYARVAVQPNGDKMNERAFSDSDQLEMNMFLTRIRGGAQVADAINDVQTLRKLGETQRDDIDSIWTEENYDLLSREFMIDKLLIGEGFGPAFIEFGRGMVPRQAQTEFAAHARNLFLSGGGRDFDAAVKTAMGDLRNRWALSETGTGGEPTFRVRPPELEYVTLGAEPGWHEEQLVEEVRRREGDPDLDANRIRIEADPLTALEKRPRYSLFVLDENNQRRQSLDPDTLEHVAWFPDYPTSPAFARFQQQQADKERETDFGIANEMAASRYMAENPTVWFELSFKNQARLETKNPFMLPPVTERMERVQQRLRASQLGGTSPLSTTDLPDLPSIQRTIEIQP